MLRKNYKMLLIGLLAIFALTGCGSDSNDDSQQPNPISPTPAPAPDTTPPVINLVGAAVVEHEAGTAYADSGASAIDNVDGVLTSSIAVTGNVDSTVPGTYTLTYNVSDASGNAATPVTRTINVVDTRPPIITLLGEPTQTVELGSDYSESGANASDTVDGDLSANITISGSVNIGAIGTYELRYDVSDSSGNSAQTLIRTVIVEDTTAPSIVSFTPEQDATDVALDAQISVLLSEAISNNSVTSSVFTVQDSGGNMINGLLALDDAGTTLSFQANDLFAHNTQYTVNLSSDLSDLSGNRLDSALSWQFTTLNPAPDVQVLPELINVPGAPAMPPSLSVNESGHAIAAWLQGGSLFANRYSPENGWQGPEELSQGSAGEPINEVEVAINNAGDIFVVWINSDSRAFTTTISSRRYTQDGGWEEIVMIDDRSGFSLQARLAVDQLGNAVVIWTFAGDDNDEPGIYASRYVTDTNSWSVSNIATYRDDVFNTPTIAMNASGVAVAAWVVGNNTIASAIFNPMHSPGENPWSIPTDIGIGDQSIVANYPQIAVNNAGEAIVAWVQATSQNTSGDIYATYYSGNIWAAARAIESLVEGEARLPRVAINNQHAIVVWTEFDGATYSVYANTLNEAKQFSGTFLLEDSPYNAGSSNLASTMVRLSSTGSVTAVWQQDAFIEENMRREKRIFINHFDILTSPGTDNSVQLPQDAGLVESFEPSMGTDINGNAIVVSQRLASNSLDIQAHIVAREQQ